MSMQSVAERVQEFKRRHADKAEELRVQIMETEQELEELYAQFEQHQGALKSCNDVLMVIQQEAGRGNPVGDPLAETDQ